MIGYRSIGDNELYFLINSDNPVYGTRKWNKIRGSGCSVSDYGTVCFFLEPYRWRDANHFIDIVVSLPDDTPTGVATYMASANLPETKIFKGREGKTKTKIKEAYPRFYGPEDIMELRLNNRFNDAFADGVREFCDKYGILFYR